MLSGQNAPSVKRALPPVGVHRTAEQLLHTTTLCEWLKTVVLQGVTQMIVRSPIPLVNPIKQQKKHAARKLQARDRLRPYSNKTRAQYSTAIRSALWEKLTSESSPGI